MEDRDKQREQKRKEIESKDPAFLRPKLDPPLRPALDCDNPSEPPIDDVFDDPNECAPIPEPALVVPDPLVIGNDSYTAECPLPPSKPGQVGTAVTIVENSFKDFFNFGTIENITANQLTFISGLTESQLELLSDPDTAVTTIAAITHLNTIQATFINEAVVALKANVNAVAKDSAETQLSCLFFNSTQTVTCEDAGFSANAYTNENVPEGQSVYVNNPSTVDADLYSSPNSQEEADQIAEDIATAGVKCHYGNDEVVVTCLDIGFSEAVPNDVDAVSVDGRLRLGTITVPADTVFSSNSRATATATATAAAESQLACFYLNDEILLTCEGEGKNGTVAGPADPAAGTSGNPVTIPAGFVTSFLSSEDANEQAEDLAESLLECYWVNDEQCVQCLPESVTDPDSGDSYDHFPESSTPLCQPAGTVRSYVSQADANAQALVLAEAQLICIYCNLIVQPKCVPEDWSGIIPVPADEPTDDWSISATRGLAEDSICAGSAQDVVNTGNSIGNLPANVTDGADCCYGNDLVTASCPLDPDDEPVDETVSKSEVVIPANTHIVCDSDAEAAGWIGTTKEYATYLAQILADAALICIWTNDEYLATCPTGAAIGDISVATSLHPGSSNNILVVDSAYISFRSKAEANSLAATVGLAQLNCVYGNPGPSDGGNGPCADSSQIYLGQPQFSANQITSPLNSTDAKTQAEALSDAMMVCADPEDFEGEPGRDGAQTNCSGDCYGYFS